MTSNQYRRTAAWALALALSWPTHIIAQTEAGVARDAKTRAPLECLHVALIDTGGHAIANAVTDSAGRFMIEAPGPGTYRVRFESFAWEPQVGPLDTLREGDFKQRAYPVAFTNMLMPDTTQDTLFTKQSAGMRSFGDWNRARMASYKKLWSYRRSREDSTKWQSRLMAPLKSPRLLYPSLMWKAGVTGSVIGQMIVDTNGMARRHSWRTVYATHPDFEKAVVEALPDLHWRPARLNGSPVCDFAQTYVRYDLDGRDPHGDVGMVWFMSE